METLGRKHTPFSLAQSPYVEVLKKKEKKKKEGTTLGKKNPTKQKQKNTANGKHVHLVYLAARP